MARVEQNNVDLEALAIQAVRPGLERLRYAVERKMLAKVAIFTGALIDSIGSEVDPITGVITAGAGDNRGEEGVYWAEWQERGKPGNRTYRYTPYLLPALVETMGAWHNE